MRVSDLASCDGKGRRHLRITQTDHQHDRPAGEERERRARGACLAEPAPHDGDPADADDGAEGEREELRQGNALFQVRAGRGHLFLFTFFRPFGDGGTRSAGYCTSVTPARRKSALLFTRSRAALGTGRHFPGSVDRNS